MTLLYDDVIGELLLAIQHTPAFQQVQRAVLVRTSEGRVRLVLELNDTASPDLVAKLEATAADAIGSWFQGPIISPSAPKSAGLRRLATHLLSTSSPWPSGWPTELPVAPGAPPEQAAPQWSALQVAVGKAPWLPIHPGRPPWRFVAEAPTITAFYGYKGGVGRTTAVAALGTLLASRGRRVVCVDLDLEAPGLARALLQTELPDHRGWLIDDLLAHSATGAGLDALPLVPIQAPLMPGASLDLVPAGVLGPTYLEKLARLDAMHHAENKSPVHLALDDLLRRIRAQHQPDHILLDCRSGLHDLAGLALHDLAHVDVLVGRGDAQELDGLQVLLPSLLRRRPPEQRRMLVLRAFHKLPFAVSVEQLERQRQDLHELFSEHFYDTDDAPDWTTLDVPHDPCPIGASAEVQNARWIGEVSHATLQASYGLALQRLQALWEPE